MTSAATDRDRVTELAEAHRGSQAAYRGVVAIEDSSRAASCADRLRRITQAVRAAGHPELAEALDDEMQAGAVLLALLTSDDEVSRAQITAALADYQRDSATVDTLIDRAHTAPPTSA